MLSYEAADWLRLKRGLQLTVLWFIWFSVFLRSQFWSRMIHCSVVFSVVLSLTLDGVS